MSSEVSVSDKIAFLRRGTGLWQWKTGFMDGQALCKTVLAKDEPRSVTGPYIQTKSLNPTALERVAAAANKNDEVDFRNY